MLTRRQFLSATAAGISIASLAKHSHGQNPSAENQMDPRDIKRKIGKLLPLHERKKPPQPGDWLDQFPKEKGQSFIQYTKNRTPSRTAYPRLYLQQIGEFDHAMQEQIPDVADALSRFFGLPTLELDPLSLDDLSSTDFRERTGSPRQILTTKLLEKLKLSRPRDAAAVLGLTVEDLYPGDRWNFVFGQASLDQRVGVWSTARLGDTNEVDTGRKVLRRRLFKLAWHETGHMFGIPHCIAYECGMNGCNHLEESDRQLLEYCPQCQAKIWWTNHYNPLKRANALLEFAIRENWEEETKYWQQAIEKLN
jgi:archaemetzincin